MEIIRTARKYKYLSYLLFILPGFLLWFVFSLLPNLQIFYLAFLKWNGISNNKQFVGFDNFKMLALDPTFPNVVKNTVFYILFLLVIQNAVALFLALILKNNTRSNRFFRTLFFSPVVLSTVMVGMTWGYMYDANIGFINGFLGTVGLEQLQLNWMGIPGLSILCIVIVHIWHNMGYPITILTAGLHTIPEALYEAAEVEGANKTQILRSVTIPLIMPTLLRVSLLTFIGGALAFDYVFTLGGTQSPTEYDTLAVFMYRSVSAVNVGRPSSVGVILALIIFLVFAVQYIASRKIEDSYI